MVEIAGDSSRDGCWSLIRLRVDGGCIVDADADGLDQDLRGLSLLEAAAVGGDAPRDDLRARGREGGWRDLGRLPSSGRPPPDTATAGSTQPPAAKTSGPGPG